jgi:hypothetical protein
VRAELPIDVGEQARANILQLGLLCGGVGVAERPQSDAPRVDDELLALCGVEFAEERDTLGPSVANVCDDHLRGRDYGNLKLRGLEHGRHTGALQQ